LDFDWRNRFGRIFNFKEIMTVDSAIVRKNFQNPSIVRPRPINMVLNAEGGGIVQLDVPEVPAPEGQEEVKESVTKGKYMFAIGLALTGFIVYKLLVTK